MKILLNFVEEKHKDEKFQLDLVYNKPFTDEEEIDILINHPEILLLCDFCERKLNHSASIFAVLDDKEEDEERKDLCLTCFLKMDLRHRKCYYHVRQNLNLSLIDPIWSLISQLLLLNALQRFGYGNWGQIKNYMDYHGSNFSEKEIQEHYQKFYLLDNLEPISFTNLMEVTERKEFMKPLINPNTQLPDPTVIPKQPVRVQAYNQKREEHLYDYDPTAQLTVCDLEFNDDDCPQEIELKLMKLEEYDHRIKERRKREQYVNQHQILSDEHTKVLLASGFQKSDVRRKMRCYSRFQTLKESEDLVSYMTLQSTLQAAIQELSRQRKREENPTFQRIFEKMKIKLERRASSLFPNTAKLQIMQVNPPTNNKRLPDPENKAECTYLDELRKKLKQMQEFRNCQKIVDFELK